MMKKVLKLYQNQKRKSRNQKQAVQQDLHRQCEVINMEISKEDVKIFLLTYGWALIVVIASIIALIYFGVL